MEEREPGQLATPRDWLACPVAVAGRSGWPSGAEWRLLAGRGESTIVRRQKVER